jgi:hypothetical protein
MLQCVDGAYQAKGSHDGVGFDNEVVNNEAEAGTHQHSGSSTGGMRDRLCWGCDGMDRRRLAISLAVSA